jgi:hypothetical protein
MDGVSMNSGAPHQIVRDMAKTQELCDVTLIRLIETRQKTFASTRDCVGEMKSYMGQMLAVT